MLSLKEFIQQFETALAEKSWSTIAELDNQMQAIVSNEKTLLQAAVDSEQAQAQNLFDQLNEQLTKLRQLYQHAEQLADQLKQETGEQIQVLGTGKAGISAYHDNAFL